MSSRLPAVRARQLIRVLEKRGWRLERTRGSHRIFTHPDRPNLIAVPVHPGDLKRPLVAGILKDAGISRDDFLKLL